jgi:hypothetical protein
MGQTSSKRQNGERYVYIRKGYVMQLLNKSNLHPCTSAVRIPRTKFTLQQIPRESGMTMSKEMNLFVDFTRCAIE